MASSYFFFKCPSTWRSYFLCTSFCLSRYVLFLYFLFATTSLSCRDVWHVVFLCSFFSTELPRCNDVIIILSLLMTNLKNLACLSLITSSYLWPLYQRYVLNANNRLKHKPSAYNYHQVQFISCLYHVYFSVRFFSNAIRHLAIMGFYLSNTIRFHMYETDLVISYLFWDKSSPLLICSEIKLVHFLFVLR